VGMRTSPFRLNTAWIVTTPSKYKQQAREDYEIRFNLWLLNEVCLLVGLFTNPTP